MMVPGPMLLKRRVHPREDVPAAHVAHNSVLITAGPITGSLTPDEVVGESVVRRYPPDFTSGKSLGQLFKAIPQ